MPPRYLVVILLGLTVAVAGCGRDGNVPRRVDARTAQVFRMWRSEASSEHPAEAWREFDAEVQELRMAAMAQGLSGQEAIDDAVCQQINGRSFNEVRFSPGENLAHSMA